MGYPALELLNIRRKPAAVVRGFIRGMYVLEGKAAGEMRDEILSPYIPCFRRRLITTKLKSEVEVITSIGVEIIEKKNSTQLI